MSLPARWQNMAAAGFRPMRTSVLLWNEIPC